MRYSRVYKEQGLTYRLFTPGCIHEHYPQTLPCRKLFANKSTWLWASCMLTDMHTYTHSHVLTLAHYYTSQLQMAICHLKTSRDTAGFKHGYTCAGSCCIVRHQSPSSQAARLRSRPSDQAQSACMDTLSGSSLEIFLPSCQHTCLHMHTCATCLHTRIL